MIVEIFFGVFVFGGCFLAGTEIADGINKNIIALKDDRNWFRDLSGLLGLVISILLFAFITMIFIYLK